MTNKELQQAKENYQKLIKDNEDLIKLKQKFLEFSEDSLIQEYLSIKNWKYFTNRQLELKQLTIIKKYLYLYEVYNGFEEKIDYELVESAFENVIKTNNNIYVYIASYKSDEFNNKKEIKPNEKPDFHLYKNLETKQDKWIPIKSVGEFKKNNHVIVFKNKRLKPIELFYKYRVMYLRQFLLDNHEYLFKYKTHTKELKVNNNTK